MVLDARRWEKTVIFRDMTTGRTRGAITEPNNVILIAGAQSLRGEQYFITGGKIVR